MNRISGWRGNGEDTSSIFKALKVSDSFTSSLAAAYTSLVQRGKHTHPKRRNKRRNSALPPSQPHHTPQKKKGEGEFLTLVASSVFKKESVQFKLDAAYGAKATSVLWI